MPFFKLWEELKMRKLNVFNLVWKIIYIEWTKGGSWRVCVSRNCLLYFFSEFLFSKFN